MNIIPKKLHVCGIHAICVSIVFFLGVFLFLETATAQKFDETGQSAIYTIGEEGSVVVNFTVDLKNNNTEDLIGGYVLLVPVETISVDTVTLNDNTVAFTVVPVDTGANNISVDFGSLVVKPGSTAKLRINLKLENVFNKQERISSVYLPSLLTQKRNTTFKVRISPSLGEPTFFSTSTIIKEEGENFITYDVETSQGVSLLWGDEYTVDIATAYVLENENYNSNVSLVNLIEETDSQSIAYKIIENSSLGYTDLEGNTFAVAAFNESEVVEVGVEARVRKKLTSPVEQTSSNIEWKLLSSGEIGQQLYSTMESADQPKEQLYAVHKEIVESFTPTNAPFNIESIDSPLETEVSTRRTSFEYSYALASAATSLGFRPEVHFGYVVYPNKIAGSYQPHFWLELHNEFEHFLADPFLSDNTNIEYFGATSDFDRISFGSWYPDQYYNSALGLISAFEDARLPQLSIESFGEFANPNGAVSIELPESKDVFAGFYNTIDISIVSNRSSLLPISNISFNDNPVSNKSQYKETLFPLALPKQKSIVPVEFRDADFFRSGIDTYTVAVTFEDESVGTVVGEIPLNFKVDVKTVWGLIGIFNGTLIVVMFILWRLFIARKNYL